MSADATGHLPIFLENFFWDASGNVEPVPLLAPSMKAAKTTIATIFRFGWQRSLFIVCIERDEFQLLVFFAFSLSGGLTLGTSGYHFVERIP